MGKEKKGEGCRTRMGFSGCEQHTQELMISVSILFFCLGEKGSFEGLNDSHRRKSKGAAKKNGGSASTTLNQADAYSANCGNCWPCSGFEGHNAIDWVVIGCLVARSAIGDAFGQDRDYFAS